MLKTATDELRQLTLVQRDKTRSLFCYLQRMGLSSGELFFSGGDKTEVAILSPIRILYNR